MGLMNINAKSVELAVSNASARVAFGSGPNDTIIVDNTFPGAVDCYVRSGTGTVVATTADTHIAAGEKVLYAVDIGHTHIAAITESGSTTIRAQVG